MNYITEQERKKIIELHKGNNLLSEDEQKKKEVIGFFEKLKTNFQNLLSKLRNSDNQNKGFQGMENDLKRIKYMTENLEAQITVLNKKYRSTSSKEGANLFSVPETLTALKKLNSYVPSKALNVANKEDEFKDRI